MSATSSTGYNAAWGLMMTLLTRIGDFSKLRILPEQVGQFRLSGQESIWHVHSNFNREWHPIWFMDDLQSPGLEDRVKVCLIPRVWLVLFSGWKTFQKLHICPDQVGQF